MRRALLLLAVALAGCGASQNAATHPITPAPVCAPPIPAHMGECVQLRYGLAPRASFGAPGWDISDFQGEPGFPGSLRFVYNQVGDGPGFRDPNFSTNCARERERHIRCGAYLFVRPGNPAGQAAVIRSVLAQTNLPPALDVEVPGAYGELCPIARDLHVPVVLAYTAPGLWPGGSTCGTRLWEAVWGGAGYAFGGWGGWVLQQTCGTCTVDQDVDHGLLALVEPKPLPPRWALLARQRALRRVLLRDGCRRRVKHHEPLGPKCRRWLREGHTIGRELA